MLVYTALSILGIPNALLLALIATLLEIIPVFGPIIASVSAILIGFVHGGFTLGLIVALAYVIIQQIESSVIYPLVMRKVLNVQPLIVIVALIVGARLGGFLGIILSVPIATALMEYLHDVGKNRDVAREKFNSEAL
jgi:predicted PurR-regulated permease PerM